ncbi:MAG: hypothetical protein ABWZ66_05305 [Pyrinomonadaceae bacterium]
MFASSVAACACSHHLEKTEIEAPTCHGHSENTEVKRESPETVQTTISEGECFCIQPAPKLIAKSEKVKIEKQQIAVVSYLSLQVTFAVRANPVRTDFVKPFFLTDSFYNLTPGRAPPVL